MVPVIWLGKTALVTSAGVALLGRLLLRLKVAMAPLFLLHLSQSLHQRQLLHLHQLLLPSQRQLLCLQSLQPRSLTLLTHSLTSTNQH